MSLIAVLVCGLAVSQALFMRIVGNGVSPFGDTYSEANAFRAAEFYATHGFVVDAGLPHIVYGGQFPGIGWVNDVGRWPLVRGAYTRYPPLPDLICGVLELLVGRAHRWAWRILPIGFGLFALVLFYALVRGSIGDVQAAWVTTSIGVAPLTPLYLHGLHFHGYAHALALIQIAVVARILLSSRGPSRPEVTSLFAVGFVQGWLGYEYIFVTCLMVIPLYWVARAAGLKPKRSDLTAIALASTLGLLTAYGLHFIQVAVFYQSALAAWQDLGSRAYWRAVGGPSVTLSYPLLSLLAVAEYAQLLFLDPANMNFSVYLPLSTALALLLPFLACGAPRRGSTMPEGWLDQGPRFHWVHVLLAVASAFAVSAVWLVAMPQHAILHAPVVQRIFILPYAACSLLLAICARRRLEGASALGERPEP